MIGLIAASVSTPFPVKAVSLSAVCISPSVNDTTNSKESVSAELFSDSKGLSVAMICRDNQSLQGPPLSGGKRDDPPRTVVAVYHLRGEIYKGQPPSVGATTTHLSPLGDRNHSHNISFCCVFLALDACMLSC